MSKDLPPDPLGHIDSLLEMITRAHEIAFTRRRYVVEREPHAEADQLVRESARIALHDAPAAAKVARDAARDDAIGRLLDPLTTRDDLTVTEAIRVAETTLTDMLQRQQQIVAELARRTDR